MEDNQFIAILTDEYIDYRKVIIDRISAVMHEAGYGTLCIAGRELRPSGRHHQSYDVCNQIYQLVNDTGAAGIVCLSGMTPVARASPLSADTPMIGIRWPAKRYSVRC